MPRLNRVFEEMKVNYGDHRVPEKILKSVEEKAAKTSKSAAAPVATVRAESRKRKEGDALEGCRQEEKGGEGRHGFGQGSGRECSRRA